MKKLKELIDKSVSVTIEIDNHKEVYETVETYVADKVKSDIHHDTFYKMVKLDTCVCLTVYPDTPVGFYVIYHYDVEKALDIALND